MHIQGVIFDNDGTLVDSEHTAARLLHSMLEEHAVILSADEVLRRFRGVQFALLMAQLREEHPHFEPEPFTRVYRERSMASFRQATAPMPGALEFVRDLKVPCCVASNGPRDKIETTLHSAGLLQYFTGMIVSAYEVNAWKPAPQLILAGAELMGLEPRHCLLVEDSHAGVQAGLAAGTQVVGYGVDTDFSAYEGMPGFHVAKDYSALATWLRVG